MAERDAEGVDEPNDEATESERSGFGAAKGGCYRRPLTGR